MQVWNELHAARWKYRTQKWCKKSPSTHHCTILSGYIFTTKAHIDNWKKLVKQQYLPHMSLQYGELRPTSGWDRFVSLGHPANFNGFRILAAILHSQTAALNRGRHLYSAGRPSHWALAHISSSICSRRKKFSGWMAQLVYCQMFSLSLVYSVNTQKETQSSVIWLHPFLIRYRLSWLENHCSPCAGCLMPVLEWHLKMTAFCRV